MAERYDALVIGGGPAGSVLAQLLARAGWSVALLEAKRFPRRKVCGEYLSATNWPLLESLGIAGLFRQMAGPEVRRVGLIAADTSLSADISRPQEARECGRALSREKLDMLLLNRARDVGVEVRQPWAAAGLAREGEVFLCHATCKESRAKAELIAPIVIAAHGSWEAGALPTQTKQQPKRPGELFAFKAHFLNCALPDDLMPLLAFPGGYGGMVRSDSGRVSLSCCIRRDALQKIRRTRGLSAGEAVLAHILQSCSALRPIFSAAVREGAWLSAGPIRPGIRSRYHRGIFVVGNAAGEAHPVVAEGITMAMQSAWLLADRLADKRDWIRSPAVRDAVGRDYAAAWRQSFAGRIRAASLIAHWAMNKAAVRASVPLVRKLPSLLTLGARMSGKASIIIRRPDLENPKSA